jgi:transposase
MATASGTFSAWLHQAGMPDHALTPEQRGLLQGAFHFRQQQGRDYYSTRLLSHFLLHAHCGLKVAQIARLLGISRPTVSRQQRLSSKEAILQAHHRLDGRPYGKLLPRYAGPIAEFLLTRPDAARADLIDFVDRTFGVRVSRIALYKFLKKFGLDAATRQAAASADPPDVAGPSALAPDQVLALPAPTPFLPPAQPVPLPAPPFVSRPRRTRGPSL